MDADNRDEWRYHVAIPVVGIILTAAILCSAVALFTYFVRKTRFLLAQYKIRNFYTAYYYLSSRIKYNYKLHIAVILQSLTGLVHWTLCAVYERTDNGIIRILSHLSSMFVFQIQSFYYQEWFVSLTSLGEPEKMWQDLLKKFFAAIDTAVPVLISYKMLADSMGQPSDNGAEVLIYTSFLCIFHILAILFFAVVGCILTVSNRSVGMSHDLSEEEIIAISVMTLLNLVRFYYFYSENIKSDSHNIDLFGAMAFLVPDTLLSVYVLCRELLFYIDELRNRPVDVDKGEGDPSFTTI